MRANLPPLTPEQREEMHKIMHEEGGLLDSLREMGINVQVISADDPRVRPPRNGGCIST